MLMVAEIVVWSMTKKRMNLHSALSSAVGLKSRAGSGHSYAVGGTPLKLKKLPEIGRESTTCTEQKGKFPPEGTCLQGNWGKFCQEDLESWAFVTPIPPKQGGFPQHLMAACPQYQCGALWGIRSHKEALRFPKLLSQANSALKLLRPMPASSQEAINKLVIKSLVLNDYCSWDKQQ